MKTASLRLFYALWPDEQVRSQLAALLAQVQGRLVPAQNLHLTMAFLGQQPVSGLAQLLAIARELPLPPMNLCLDRMGYFKRHGVLWVGMEQTPQDLAEAQQALAARLTEAGIAFDASSRFRPHVTLARDAAAPAQREITPIRWQPKGLVLVSSKVVDKVVRYEVL